MQFETFVDAHSAMLWGAFAIALVMGVVVNKTNFCTMGAVSDFVNMDACAPGCWRSRWR